MYSKRKKLYVDTGTFFVCLKYTFIDHSVNKYKGHVGGNLVMLCERNIFFVCRIFAVCFFTLSP